MQPKEIQVDDENEEPHNQKKETKRKQPEQTTIKYTSFTQKFNEWKNLN